MMDILSATDDLCKGLALMGIRVNGRQRALTILEFGKHFGLLPTTLADMWFDLQQTLIPEAQKEKSKKGFNSFLKAHYYLWCYEKNAHMLASRFHICECYCRWEPLWKWIKRIGELAASKIGQPEDYFEEEMAIQAVTQDGVDFAMWEPKHPRYNQDKCQCSHKFRSAGVKYLVALSVFCAEVVMWVGPNGSGLHDLEMFQKRLKTIRQ